MRIQVKVVPGTPATYAVFALHPKDGKVTRQRLGIAKLQRAHAVAAEWAQIYGAARIEYGKGCER